MIKPVPILSAIQGKQLIRNHYGDPGGNRRGEKVLRSERYYGKVARSFTLPHEVDEAKALAKCTDGVLELTLSKKATTAAKKLAIQ